MSLHTYVKELYMALTNETAATVIGNGSLSARQRMFMLDRARNIAAWTAPQAGILGRVTARDEEQAREWLSQERRRLERALDEVKEGPSQ